MVAPTNLVPNMKGQSYDMKKINMRKKQGIKKELKMRSKKKLREEHYNLFTQGFRTENECLEENYCANGNYGRYRIYKFKIKRHKK